MGFKDLYLFNIALLGKQLWRLFPAPDSLLYRILRAKYFPDGDLLHSSAPARASYAWKGFHQALSRLGDGFFWTLGIDSNVRLFCDRWGGFSPISLTDSFADNDEVPLCCRDFMIPGQALWDRSKLSAVLSPPDADNILGVPISVDHPDTLIWGDHDSGIYSVRSGYLYLQRPPTPPPPRFWKILAKLPTVPKVWSFGWRCGRDALPVGSRLRDTGLSSGSCPLCGNGLESTLHAIRDCPDSLLALRQAGFRDHLLTSPQASALDWLTSVATSLSRDSLAPLLNVLWGLWRRRNTWVHEHSLSPLPLVVGSVVSLCRDYTTALAPVPTTSPAASAPRIGDRLPPARSRSM
ncbi:hypothetical protein V6N12_009458 [Hibiscus sabdariffa]|uniref:Reverse transcriptase zinc-binding domain-containing protein n=1 Tax=Hibiscus sabdariffa TaxID=183260 RepID=A0ABR2E972_9ROSI